MTGAPDVEAREFADRFRRFLDWVHGSEARDDPDNEVVALVTGFVGAAGREHSVLTRAMPIFEHVNLQTALDAWSDEAGRTVSVHGVTVPPHHEPPRLDHVLGGEGVDRLRLCAPALVDLPNGPGTTLGCLLRAVLLVTDERGRYVVFVAGPGDHDPRLRLEVGGLPTAAAQAVLAEVDDLRGRLNVYRGHVLDVEAEQGGVSLTFTDLPRTNRAEVVLPESVLTRVERHALGVATHRAALLAAGQHLKRGLLLYGPPGTGKTHTTRYLVGAMEGYTRLLLTGRSLHAIGAVAALARDLEPAVIVLEDVDLVAEDRDFGHGTSPVLFDLLDAMDGAAADADLLFLLTTNRVDVLERALAARPGRVDVAVEIALPDADARRQLFGLYARSVSVGLSDADLEQVLERTEGVTASFLKELLRRAVVESLAEHSPLRSVDGPHVLRALDDLLDSTQQVTRGLLGVGNDPTTLPAGGASRPGRRMHYGRMSELPAVYRDDD